MGTDCTPALCVNGICARTCTTSSDCDPSAYCDSGTCAARLLQSQPCSVADSCAGSGAACVDGVCCESACTGLCQACDVAGSVGLCVPILGGTPHGTRAACEGAGTACGGACNGMNTMECTYPGPTISCGTTCAGGEQTNSACDGTGKCAPGMPVNCNAYACDGQTKCRSTCASATDCAEGYTCTGAACLPVTSTGDTCAADGHTVVDGEGHETDCAPYVCSGGQCASTCLSASDCVTPSVCDDMSQCVALSSSTGSSASACACATGARGRAGTGCRGVLALVALAAARRRRRAGRHGRQKDASRSGGIGE